MSKSNKNTKAFLKEVTSKRSGAYLNNKQYADFIATRKRVKELEAALQLHLDFLASLPYGWLGKTTGDIGLLNEAYIASRKLGMNLH